MKFSAFTDHSLRVLIYLAGASRAVCGTCAAGARGWNGAQLARVLFVPAPRGRKAA